MMKKLTSVIAVIVTCIYPVLFIFCMNAGELHFRDIYFPLILYLCIGFLLTALFFVFTKSMRKGALGSIAVCILIFNFGLIKNGLKLIFTECKYWHALLVCIFVAAFIIWVMETKLSEELQQFTVSGIASVFSALILINFVSVLPGMISSAQNEDKSEDAIELKTEEIQGELPNIYYLIFDEYSNFDVMEKYFDYDNSDFGTYLENLGFTVSYNSANESSQSSTVMGNYVSLEYVVTDSMSETEKKPYRINGKLWDLIEGYGYKSWFIGLTSWFGRSSAIDDVTDNNGAETVSGETFSDLIFKNSVFYPFFVRDDERTNENSRIVKNTFEWLQTVDLSGEKKQFVQSYLRAPHQPFLFDETGKPNSGAYFNNWEDPQYYRGYYIYVTTQIKLALKHLVSVDPDCIIILQSDHSARYLINQNGEEIISNEDKKKIINAVYYMGQPTDEMIDQSGVNTLRIVFGKALGVDLPILEVP